MSEEKSVVYKLIPIIVDLITSDCSAPVSTELQQCYVYNPSQYYWMFFFTHKISTSRLLSVEYILMCNV